LFNHIQVFSLPQDYLFDEGYDEINNVIATIIARGAQEMISRRADSNSNSFRDVNETSQLISTEGSELQSLVRDYLVWSRANSLASYELRHPLRPW
jgi:hypothetical protein